MSKLMELYNAIYEQAEQIDKRIVQAEEAMANIKAAGQIDVPARIEHLEEVLEKVDEYVLKVKGFQQLAKKNLDSQNVLTIEAPPGYRVNLNRLRNWSMLIDPQSDNDPYAQRVLAVAKCDECFLEWKRSEFEERIEELKKDQTAGLTEEIKRLEHEIDELRVKKVELISGDEANELAQAVKDEHAKYKFDDLPSKYADVGLPSDKIGIGAYGFPLTLGDVSKEDLESQFGKFCDAENGSIFFPAVFDTNKEVILTVSCTPSRSKQLDRALQHYVLKQIESNPAGMRKVYVIDGVRFNSNSMGHLRQIEGEFPLAHIPRNPEQLTATLEEIVSSFADMDDFLDICDSVEEYNGEAEAKGKQKLPYTTLVLFGWPTAYGERDKEMVRRIMINYERYGISCIVASYDTGAKRTSDEPQLTEYAMHNAVKVNMNSQETTITVSEETRPFEWYYLEGDLPATYVESIKEKNIEANTQGNEYIKRYSLTDRPIYTREYKKLELPIGIDGKDIAHSIAFENENFATYLVGASRSGKSTLLHTLIAGLIRNYHPDNVELWLADFKQLEFKRYMKHLPPHVKYVLLDESPELVFDLVDKLTDEMMARQRLFARLGKQRIDQIDTTKLDKPLPVIFIILDEFSIMSQSIADSPIYKLRLQNLLAKGAALGMKFLFSSQTFTTGVAGLTPTARAQIQQRIAMKGTNEEISETLELTANLKTDQVRNWMEALPPHYALIKYRQGADTLPIVKRLLVMYFEDYAPRDKMIDDINKNMHVVDNYAPSDIDAYVDKNPVLVDGNSYTAFREEDLVAYKQENDGRLEDYWLSLGTPRLMTPMRPAILSPETRENILMIARGAEQACAASILMSALKSFVAQGGEVEMWVYGRHPLYQAYKQSFAYMKAKLVEGIDDVCDRIRFIKDEILEKKHTDRLIVMVGVDRICMDFDFVDEKSKKIKGAKNAKVDEYNTAELKDEDTHKQEYAQKWIAHRTAYRRKAKKEAKSKDELAEMIRQEEMRFHDRYYSNLEEDASTDSVQTPLEATVVTQESEYSDDVPEKEHSGAYDASEDFVYIMKQGSRNGTHFMMALNSLADLKQTGVKADFFRHKLLFQISADDSRTLIGNKGASLTPEHVCLYDDTLSQFSFRPYIHKGIGWEGWYIDDLDKLVSPYGEAED